MKPHRYVRSIDEKNTFLDKLAKWDFVQHPVTFYWEPYKDTRTLAQNDKMWALLRDIASQKEWAGQKLSPEDWKDLLTVAYKKEKDQDIRVVPSLDYSGVVMLGMRTSDFKVNNMSEFIECIYAWGSENGVKWTEEEKAG